MKYFATLLALILPLTMSADVWRVGPTQQYKVPSAVSSLVQDGDEVWIDPAEYVGDVTNWRANNLKLRCSSSEPGSVAILRADGKSAEQKAIWVIKGNDCVVGGIDFRDCVVPDRNGAGIRVEGTNITVSHCAFRKNQDGILAGANLNSTIRVEHCEFEQSGAGDGLSHAIYIGHVKAFFFLYNYSHGTLVGHEYKSRAHFNYIGYNRITNESGTGSRNIDIPNGGTSVIIGNIIHKGANAENGNVIGYGLEGLSDTVDNALYLSHNTVVSDRGASTLLRIDAKTNKLHVVNNVLVGNMTYLIGTAATSDTLNNLSFATPAAAGLVNATAFDYSLTATSPARGKAVDAGVATSTLKDFTEMPLTALLHYVHPCQERLRISTRDMGAYEYEGATDVQEDASIDAFTLLPNPAGNELVIRGAAENSEVQTQLFSNTGQCVLVATGRVIDVAGLPDGIYTVVRGAQAKSVIVRH